MKICKNGNFRHISGISNGTEFFSKVGLGHVLSIANAHLYGKNQKKLMKKSRENAKKPVFRHISGIFGRNEFFPEIGLRHNLGIAILHLCAKNQQKVLSQSREKLVTDGRTDARTTVNL